jgi:hypothetical protein
MSIDADRSIDVSVAPTIRKNQLGRVVTPWRVAVSVTGCRGDRSAAGAQAEDVAVFATSIWTSELVAAVWVSSPAHVAQYVYVPRRAGPHRS